MNLEVLQHEVQCKLGGCMIRVQQYEHLLKAMVACIDVQGPLEQIQALQEQQRTGVRGRTLGNLVGMFTGGYLSAAICDGEVSPKDYTSVGGATADVAWASIRFNTAMSPEHYTQTKEELAELVALRNELVHHLIERFGISDEDDCRAAADHLDSCHEKINEHYQRLKNWAAGLAHAQMLASSFFQSKAFEDAFVHGINPDGSACWTHCTIVECLREAETACQVDGWTALQAAIAFIAVKNRDQIPSRYGCKTWRKLLKISGQFELRSVPGSSDEIGQAWYRSCSPN